MARSSDELNRMGYATIIRRAAGTSKDQNTKSKKPKQESYLDQFRDSHDGSIIWIYFIMAHIIQGTDNARQGIINLFKQIFMKKNINSAGGGGGGDATNLPPDNPNNPRGNKMNFKIIAAAIILALTLIVSPLIIGINDAGHRTVIQYPDGTLNVKFTPGLYWQWFGSVDVYKDVITFDFDKIENDDSVSIDQKGIAVRYQDGGVGTVYGIARFRLPNTIEQMVKVHKDFRSNNGVAFKTIKPITEEIANHTAGLMTSEESYAEKRGTYTQYVRDQLQHGKFATTQKEVTEVEAGMEFCLEKDLAETLKKECRDIKRTTKQIPVIATKDGLPVFEESDFSQYGIELTGFNIVDWDYEPKTLAQISAKREATMAIITSKANAERAKQDAITAEQQGLANVKTAQYEEEVIKQKAVVVAQRQKEVAEIAAQQQVAVAEQGKLEAEQKKLAAVEIKQEQILLGEGEAERKSLVMKADGALQQKLDAWKEVNFAYAKEFGKQKWVPEVQMGASAGTTGSAAQDLIQLMTVQNAKALSLDMQMKGTTSK